MLCCAGRSRALPLVYLVLVAAGNVSVPRMLTSHHTGHEHNKQASKQAKESLVVHTEKSYKMQLFTLRHCLPILS